jgi:hypothetical protein
VALLVVLGLSLTGLDPSAGCGTFSAAVLAAAILSALSPARAFRAYRSTHLKPIGYGIRLALAALLVATYLATAIRLLAEAGGGLQWLAGGFLVAITIAATNAWVLLVEVLR